MLEAFEAARHPLAVGGSLEEDARPGPITEHGGEALGLRAHPAFDQLACLGKDANLAFLQADIVNLGLVFDVALEDGIVRVKMTTTSPGCPVGAFLAAEVERALLTLPGTEAVPKEFAWNPSWSLERMSAGGRRKPGGDRGP